MAMSAPALSGQPIARDMRSLLRAMTAYYTHLTKAQHTRPFELKQALRQDFCLDADLAARQREVLAHIGAEAELERRYRGDQGAKAPYNLAAVCNL